METGQSTTVNSNNRLNITKPVETHFSLTHTPNTFPISGTLSLPYGLPDISFNVNVCHTSDTSLSALFIAELAVFKQLFQHVIVFEIL